MAWLEQSSNIAHGLSGREAGTSTRGTRTLVTTRATAGLAASVGDFSELTGEVPSGKKPPTPAARGCRTSLALRRAHRQKRFHCRNGYSPLHMPPARWHSVLAHVPRPRGLVSQPQLNWCAYLLPRVGLRQFRDHRKTRRSVV